MVSLDLLKKEDAVWVTPLVFGMSCLVLFWDKIREKLPFLKEKVDTNKNDVQDKHEKRQTDLKLISRRVKEVFNEEIRKNGLIIGEAYYGSKASIEQLTQQSSMEKIKSFMSPEFNQKIIDVTDSTRFYIDNSRLILPRGSKIGLYGFYKLDLPDEEVPVLYFK